MALKQLTLDAFLAQTASAAPAPGGGSIAALNAASSAALIAMVAHLTLGKEKYRDVQSLMERTAAQAEALRVQFLDLIDEDSEAFPQIIGAYKLPKGTEEEKAVRSAAIQAATKTAALVPYRIGELACELFDLAETVIDKGNKGAVTDGAIAVINALAAIRTAFLNVKINLGSIKEQAFVEEMQKKLAAIESMADTREKELLERVKL